MAERPSVGIVVVLALLLAGLLFVIPMFGMGMWGPMMGGGMMGGWGYPTGMGWGFIVFLGTTRVLVATQFLSPLVGWGSSYG